jgi:transposase
MLFLAMNSLRPAFEKRGFDHTQWKRQMHRHPQEYVRRKLRVLKAYAQQTDSATIVKEANITLPTLRRYIRTYAQGGFDALCQPEKRDQPKRLTPTQEAQFKRTLLGSRPADHGLTGNIWTGQLMSQYVQQTFNVSYKSGIYDLLGRLNLSHQKAHADYANADPAQQQAFLNTLKDTLADADPTHTVVFYDEFSVCEKPTSYYGWAERNTRPTVVTDEKKVPV